MTTEAETKVAIAAIVDDVCTEIRNIYVAMLRNHVNGDRIKIIVQPDGSVSSHVYCGSGSIGEDEYFGRRPHEVTVWDSQVWHGWEGDAMNYPLELVPDPDGDFVLVKQEADDKTFPYYCDELGVEGLLTAYDDWEHHDNPDVITRLAGTTQVQSGEWFDAELSHQFEDVTETLNEWAENGNYMPQ
jgi:hypothetical protein